MSSIPSNMARVPNALASRIALGNLGRTNLSLLNIQQQIATGRSILRPSDDIVRSATIGVLDDRLELSTQRIRNLSHAAASLDEIDSALDEANRLALQGKSIASEQLNITSNPSERASQAIVVDSLIQSLFTLANGESVAGHIFGGSQTTRAPIESFLGGYRYVGSGPGLTTDLGLGASIPITLGDGNAVAARSSRVRGNVNLDPDLTNDTRLADLAGARGLGISIGTVQFSFNGASPTSIDLTGADTIGDVATRIESAIREYETANSVTILGPGGVSVAGESLALDVPAGNLEFLELGAGVTARDLGLSNSPAFTFSSTNANGVALDPRLTWRSPITSLTGVTGTLGSIRVNNAGRSAVVDLSGAQTLQDVKNLIEASNLGVRVQINAAGTGIDVLNEVAAASANALSISEITGNGLTATRLGIRSFDPQTLIQDFNHGRGVTVIDGVINPTTGAIDPTLNEDFVIQLGDTAQTRLTIDLRPQDMLSVQTVINRINAEAAPQLAAAGLLPTDFVAGVADGANGFALTQATTFAGTITVETRNNSPAAEQLGLKTGTYNATSATFTGQDRATVRVESLFTQLIDLRDSLRTNSTSGIALAGEDLDGSADSLVETRGLVGGYARRIEDANTREEDRALLDERTRSDLRDVDLTVAATRFSLLQTQLEAGLRVTAMASQRSLLDFLG